MRPGRAKTVAGLGALLALAILAYSNHFGNAFHFDDSHTIIANPYIRDLRNIGLMFTDTRAFSTLPSNRAYRPVVTTSLAVDYAIAGGLKPPYFHVSTFFWFVVQILLMFVLFRHVCDAAHPDPRNSWVALFGAGLYAVHPANAETVNYVIQRGDVYSTLGVIAALVLYASFPRHRYAGWYLVPAVLGVLSKPPALMFPAILLVYVLLFEESRFLKALRRCVPSLLVTAIGGYLLLAMIPSTFLPTTGSAYAYRITQPLVALRYFSSFFVPTHLTADSDFVAVNGVFERGAWLGFVFIVIFIAMAMWCSLRRRWRPAAFGLWWFLLALVPTSGFALAEVENDHRMYFPFAGLVLAVCWPVALAIYDRRRMRRPLIFAGVAACAVVFSVLLFATRQRNEVWRTDESLWFDVTLKSPRNGRGLMNYGLTQMEKGNFHGALLYFERAAVFNPAYSILEINRGIANGSLNRNDAAEQHFRKARMLAPDSAESHFYYGRWLRQRKRILEAVAELEYAMRSNPDFMPARYLAMQAYAEQGDWPRVTALADNILQRFPNDEAAASFLARAKSAPGSIPAAGSSLTAAPPRTADDYVNLSLTYYLAGEYEKSVTAAQEALKLQLDYAAAYNNIAAAQASMQNWDQAIEAARQALKIAPGFQLAQNNLTWAESQKKMEEQRKGSASR